MADAIQNLDESASGPAKMKIDGQEVEEHKLTDQVAYTCFAMATRARSRHPLAGVTFTGLRAPGAVYPAGSNNGQEQGL
jgi:hypothetical protein